MLVWKGVCATLCVLLCLQAVEAGSLTESDAIARFVATSPRISLVDWKVADAEADLAGSQVDNPEVSYIVEDADVREQQFAIVQRLPISGRRSLIRASAREAAVAASLDGHEQLRRTAHDVRLVFYDVLSRTRARDLLASGAGRLEELVRVLGERERRGEGSGYDVLRAEQELAGIMLQIGSRDAELTGALAKLASFVGELPAATEVFGDFSLRGEEVSVEQAVARALSDREDLQALTRSQARQQTILRAARRARVPEPVVSAGYKRVDDGSFSESGFTAAIGIPLPIFNRGQVEARRAVNARERVKTELAVLRQEVEAEVRAAHALARSSRAAVQRFADEYSRKGERLEQIATLAYEEGEHGILELLDAYRFSLESRLRALDLRYQAKKFEIQLEKAMGTEVRP